MKDLIVTINSATRKVKLNKDFIGLCAENLQGNIIVDFQDEFVDGLGFLEVNINGNKFAIGLDQDAGNKIYSTPIKSNLLKSACNITCQVKITQSAVGTEAPVFRSEQFVLPCKESICAEDELPEDPQSWQEFIESKVAEIQGAGHEHDNKQILDETTASYTTEEKEKLAGLSNYDDTEIKEQISDKVSKVDGKDLSTNDYTNEDKDKLADVNMQSIDFAESERQKSKNLLVYPYAETTKTTNGITFTDNGDGSITINGTNNGSGNSNFFFTSTTEFKLSVGTYTLSNFVSTNNNVNVVLYDGTLYHQVPSNSSKTLTYNNETTCYIYIGINKGTTETFNNVVVKPMLVSGTELGDYQPYNGAIVHEKEAERYDLVYDRTTRQTPLGGTLAYTKGIYGTVEMDLSKYRFIRVYYGHNNKQYTMIINCDIGCNGSSMQLAEDTNILATLVKCTKTSFTLVKNGYYTVPSMTFIDRTSGVDGSGTYSVYRIEGVY